MPVLPDYLDHGLRVVFCGTAAGTTSAARGHYYAGPGSEFWRYLFEAGLTPYRVGPADDTTITSHGIGLTDLAKHVAASSDRGLASKYDIAGFVAKIERHAPAVVAFHGKEAAKAVSRALGYGRDVSLGLQPWRIAESHVFVVPNASGANRNAARLEGKPSRVAWFVELRGLVQRVVR
jgi:double-stranded uracil-DNA glycosylase